MLDRRSMLSTAAAALAGVSARSVAQARGGEPDSARQEQHVARLLAARRRLDFDGRRFSGPAYDWCVDRGRSAQFFLIGEEHGIAENPKFAAQLFGDLVDAGYSRVGLEISPPIAFEIDRLLRAGGMPALEPFLRAPENVIPFFGMREEATWLAAVRSALSGEAPVLLGLDYDVGTDRHLIGMLEAKPMPAAARKALADLKADSAMSWARYDKTRDPRFIYGFAGDPALVRAVRSAWPRPDAMSDWIIATLENSFEINRLYVTGQTWASNQARADNLRRNLLRHLARETRNGALPRIFFKLGSNHMVRGLTDVRSFDLGTLVPEIAATHGGAAFQLMVLPGARSPVAQFNPSSLRYENSVPKGGYLKGLDVLSSAAWPDAFTLFETRPLRPFVDRADHAELVAAIHGYDAILIMSGSSPSANL